MPKQSEVEIKLRLDPEKIRKFANLERLAGVDPLKKHYRTIYFDDNKHHLFKNGFELRVRQDGHNSIQTLKTAASVDRGEWEREAADGEPSLEGVEGAGLEKLRRRRIALRRMFSLEVDRGTWSLRRDGACIEVALDEGKMEAGGRERPIRQAELELKSGEPDYLYELAQKICKESAATPFFVSKGALGYRLADRLDDAPARGLTLHFEGDASVADAFQAIVDACLKQFSLNEELLETAIDTEAVHQARVAIRRLRAAFSMFKDVVVGEDADAARRDLKWLSRLLGEARDLDVFLENPMKQVALEHPDVPGARELARRLESMRDRARHRLDGALHSDRFRALLLGVARCAHHGAWRRGDDGRFTDFALDTLEQRLNSVRRKRKAARGLDARKRHRLRIKAKKLRYMFEFLKPVASRKALGAVLDRLERLQDLLGALNDVIAGERLLGQLVEESRAPVVSFAANLVRETMAVSPKIKRKAIKTHAGLRRLPPFVRG
jgi:inorganic triphosphatase YgiF